MLNKPKIMIPDPCLVVLMGATGAGKTTFARRQFKPTEIISSDFCRAIVSDDENDLTVTNQAFEILHSIVAKRLARRKLTVVDATNVLVKARKPLLAMARRYRITPVAIVLDLPETLCWERTEKRADRHFGPEVTRRHIGQLKRSLGKLEPEGFRQIHILDTPEEIDTAIVERVSEQEL